MKPKTKQQSEVKYGYRVRIDQRCTHSYSEPVEFGSWSESYSNSIHGMIVKSDTHPDVVSTHDLQPGDRGFVVWVEWSSGDSFGRGDCNNVEALGLFRTYEDAEVLKNAIEVSSNRYDRTSYENSGAAYSVITPDGQVFTSGWAPWLGYFESLERVHIDRVEVQ